MPVHRSRVLLADDHTFVAELCKQLLEAEFNVVGLVKDGRELVRASAALKPDVVIVDVAMPLLNGLDAGEQVKKLLPAVKLVYLTMNPDPAIAAEAFRRGASAYLLKNCGASELTLAVHEVLRGKCYLSSRLSRHKINELRWQGKDKKLVDTEHHLTKRQREVLQLLAEGKVMKEIGAILNLSTRTVAFHKYRMMEALGVKSDAELIRSAVRRKMIA